MSIVDREIIGFKYAKTDRLIIKLNYKLPPTANIPRWQINPERKELNGNVPTSNTYKN